MRDGVPISRNGVPVEGERKDGATAIADTLEQMLDPTYAEVTATFKTNTAHVLFVVYISSNDIKVKTKALDLLIKLTKDDDIDVIAESCKKLVYLISGGHDEETHSDSIINSLREAKDTLDPTEHAELIAEIDDLLAHN